MEIVKIVVLVSLIYLAVVIPISFIRALIAFRKGREHAKKTFKQTFCKFFLEFLGEMLDPFNWF